MYRLRDSGFTARLVGGGVRDLLIGRTPKDFDIVTDATPEQIKKLFRNCRLIGRRFRLAHLHFRDEIIEVATFRAAPAENEEADIPFEEDAAENPEQPDERLLVDESGMLLRDNLFGTPEEDAWRRDFTVNALSYDIGDFSIIDYVGGMEDLELRLIRTIGDPGSRFTEDPVRMLRAVRLSAQLDFAIEEHCWKALCEMATRITQAAPARLFDELLKLLLSGAAARCFNLLEQSGLLAALLPEYHQWLQECAAAEPDAALAWLDRQGENGATPSPQLALATLFGNFLTGDGRSQVAANAPFQVRLDSSLALFMQEVAGRIHIPQRILMKLREILLLESRLVQTPGKRPQSVLARPGFSDAISYLHLQGERDRDLARSARWWERYAGEGVMVPPEHSPAATDAAPGRKKRRRRRRRRGAPNPA